MISLFLLALLPFAHAGLTPIASCSATPPMSCSSTASNTCCSPRYGIVVLAQQWIPNYGPRDAFTVHGLWPNTCSNGRAPGNGCDDARLQNSIEPLVQPVGNLLNDLNTYWPSYKNDNDAFWVHEWNKHGTCVTTLDPKCFSPSDYRKGDEVVAYFRKTLELRQKYDLFAALARAGISPSLDRSKGVPVMDYVNAVKKAYGVSTQFSCKGNVITEVKMYFHVRGTDDYVPIPSPLESTCRGSVIFPPKRTSTEVLERWQRQFDYEWVDANAGVEM